LDPADICASGVFFQDVFPVLDSSSEPFDVSLPGTTSTTLPPGSGAYLVVDGFDEKNSKYLSEEGKTFEIQTSDNNWVETESGYYTSYKFSEISIPPGATLTEVEIYVEHYEEEGFGSELDWMVGTSVHNPTIRAGTLFEKEDSWDVTSLFVNNPEQLDSLELKIINNDESGKKTFTDSIYVIVSWTT